jgi:undecaprenyl-diphosphatase
MPLLHLIIISLIQGVTEFLPVSSSGHLALYPLLSGAPDQGLSLDVAAHVGTLFAVIIYFRADVVAAARGGVFLVSGRSERPEARLALLLILSAIPLIIAGVALSVLGLTDVLRSVAVIGWATIIGGAILWWADGQVERQAGDDWRLSHAMAMGIAQVFALIPGASRSGVTMTMARWLGYDRTCAARLSMLMSIPAIMAAGGYTALKLLQTGDLAIGGDAAIAVGLSFISALLALSVMMRMLRTWTMTPFVLYRFALGAALLWVAYG